MTGRSNGLCRVRTLFYDCWWKYTSIRTQYGRVPICYNFLSLLLQYGYFKGGAAAVKYTQPIHANKRFCSHLGAL